MSDLQLGDGATFSHQCEECGGVVTILAPEKNGGGDAAHWKRWRKFVRSQVMWPLLCPTCKGWWNERIGYEDLAFRPPDAETDPDVLAGKHQSQAERDEHRRCLESIAAARSMAARPEPKSPETTESSGGFCG